MIFSKGFIIWILLFSPCPSHQKAVMEKPLALAKIVEVSSSEEPTALALHQQVSNNLSIQENFYRFSIEGVANCIWGTITIFDA